MRPQKVEDSPRHAAKMWSKGTRTVLAGLSLVPMWSAPASPSEEDFEAYDSGGVLAAIRAEEECPVPVKNSARGQKRRSPHLKLTVADQIP